MARPQAFNTAEVLHSAMQVFWRKGYEATSMQDLMTAMGLSKSSLYTAFGNKHELFLAAFDGYRKERAREMAFMLGQAPSRDAIEQFFVKIVMDAAEGTESNGCMSINQAVELAPHAPEVRDRVMNDFTQIESALSDAIQKGQAEGSIRSKDDPSALARMLVIAFPGLQVMRRAGLAAEKVRDDIRLLMTILD